MKPTQSITDPLLEAILNLSRFHREHEKFYASSPREVAVRLQRHARTLHALADRWSSATPSTSRSAEPVRRRRGSQRSCRAAARRCPVHGGRGQARRARVAHPGPPGDRGRLRGHWRLAGQRHAGLVGHRRRARRHPWPRRSPRRPASDHRQRLARRATRARSSRGSSRRAADILDKVDYTPAALRADLDGPRRSASLLHSAAEIINCAADLCSDSAGLVNDNERRWRVFRERVAAIVESSRSADASVASGET